MTRRPFKYTGKILLKSPDSFYRGIGEEAGLSDLVTSGVIRGNPRGAEMTANSWKKSYVQQPLIREIKEAGYDGKNIDRIAHRVYNRSLSEEEFARLKDAENRIKIENHEPSNNLMARIRTRQFLDGYANYEDYLAQNYPETIGRDGQPLAYFYDNPKNPSIMFSGYGGRHNYAASKYGVKVRNASMHKPFIHRDHLHYSFEDAVPLSNSDVSVYKRGPFKIGLELNKDWLKYKFNIE